MRNSRYNVFFDFEDQKVGYNTLSREFILIDKLLYDLFDVGIKKSNLNELQEIHSDFYIFLIQKGFIINDDIDEFEIVKKKSFDVDNDDSFFHLIVNPTMNCNFKCWYCYETHIKDSKMDEKTIEAIIRFVERTLKIQKNIKTFVLSFFGGEPLLYFDKVIKPIIINVSSLCQGNNVIFNCGMTTNGLLINEGMLDVCKMYGLNGFQITLDGNKEQHDKIRFISEGRGSYDKIVSNIVLIAKKQLFANVRINCSPSTMHGLEDILNNFSILSKDEIKFIKFDLQKVWQENDTYRKEIDDFKVFLREQGYFVQSAINDSAFDSCYGDKRYQATINYNGEVFKCTARDFKDNSGEGKLDTEGLIKWNEKYEKRLNSKFKNTPCKECRILPLCLGGCSQQAIENEGVDYCVMNFDEEAKTEMVIKKFKEMFA